MTNIEKAEKVKVLSESIQSLEENLSQLKIEHENYKKGYQARIKVYCFRNYGTSVLIDDELFQHIIGLVQDQLNDMNNILDDLLNGEANRLKEKFSIFVDEIKECEGEE